MVYSEAGGATKTTTAASLAMCAAASGSRTVLVDLDPRAITTEWLGVEAHQPGWHSGAVLKADDAAEWIDQVIVMSRWSELVGVIPARRSLANREAEAQDGTAAADLRLRRALAGLDAELVVLDSANRPGGAITKNALNAATRMVYASTPTPDGVGGVRDARDTVRRFVAARTEIGAPAGLVEAGIIVGAYPPVVPRVHRAGLEQLDGTGLLLSPQVPHRIIVQECRATQTWYGDYEKGAPVVEAYTQLLPQVLA